MITNLKYTLAYVASILAVNIGFMVVPMVPIGSEMWAPMSLLVGAIFVLRDFAQREVGHGVLIAMLIGAVLSYWLASPFVAVASVVAFMISETADWIVYSVTKRPLRQRIVLSSLIGTPLDSAVFLLMIGAFSWLGCALMIASKMIAALVIVRYMRIDDAR